MTETRISDFSRRFSAALQGVMREHGATVNDVATAADRSKGYVSEHTSGAKAPDTDLIDAIASVIGYDTSTLLVEIARRMEAPRPRANASVSAAVSALDAELERGRELDRRYSRK